MSFGLIGRGISHSFSPELHAMIGLYDYGLYPLEPEELSDFMNGTDLEGFNVTMPYKRDVIPFCTALSPRAEAIGSVNTVVRRPDGWYGDNTDYFGLEYLLGDDAEALRGEKAVVLGSGGASRTVCAVLKDKGIIPVVISRSGEDNYENISRHDDAALIVNATPVGMYPNNGPSPVDAGIFKKCRLVLDLIYNPAKTGLILQAEELGIPARNGLAMLCAQAAAAGELFSGRRLPPSLTADMLSSLERKRKNIVIIGMPGSGKSTVARYLGEITGRETADTDEIIRERTNTGPGEYLSENGEAEFRKLETAVLAEVSARTGIVISCGGGIVTVPENRAFIRQNGVCVLLERELSLLATGGRPLSASVGVEELWRQRAPLYDAWSDMKVKNDDPHLAAKRIAEELKL